MKKTLAATITSALVIGVASTTFAAANPFSDVPTSHWSFDAVAKLAQEGVIEGYGDNTFRGDAHITRYEMAQMVAKAMAKEEAVDAQTKAMIDKLAAEYSAELDNLGVRVANLESKIDNVTWGGKIRLRTERDNLMSEADPENGGDKHWRGQSYYELWARAQVNEDWKAVVEFSGWRDMNGESGRLPDHSDTSTYSYGDADDNSTNVFVQGPLFGADAKIGKFDSWSYQGYIIDDNVRGAELIWGGGDKTRVMATAGRVGGSNSDFYFNDFYDTANYKALEVQVPLSKATNFQVSWNQIQGSDMYRNGYDDETNNIWTVGFDAKLGGDFKLEGIYAKSSIDDRLAGGEWKDLEDNDGYNVMLRYKSYDLQDPGSYQIWTGYSKVPTVTQVSSTQFRGWDSKGWEIGFGYVPTENVLVRAYYFDGEQINKDENKDIDKVRAQVEFYF